MHIASLRGALDVMIEHANPVEAMRIDLVTSAKHLHHLGIRTPMGSRSGGSMTHPRLRQAFLPHSRFMPRAASVQTAPDSK